MLSPFRRISSIRRTPSLAASRSRSFSMKLRLMYSWSLWSTDINPTIPGLLTGRHRSTITVTWSPEGGVGICHWKASPKPGTKPTSKCGWSFGPKVSSAPFVSLALMYALLILSRSSTRGKSTSSPSKEGLATHNQYEANIGRRSSWGEILERLSYCFRVRPRAAWGTQLRRLPSNMMREAHLNNDGHSEIKAQSKNQPGSNLPKRDLVSDNLAKSFGNTMCPRPTQSVSLVCQSSMLRIKSWPIKCFWLLRCSKASTLLLLFKFYCPLALVSSAGKKFLSFQNDLSTTGTADCISKWTSRACDRCCLWKTRCHTGMPCRRCRSDNAICHLSRSNKLVGRVFPKDSGISGNGYIQRQGGYTVQRPSDSGPSTHSSTHRPTSSASS